MNAGSSCTARVGRLFCSAMIVLSAAPLPGCKRSSASESSISPVDSSGGAGRTASTASGAAALGNGGLGGASVTAPGVFAGNTAVPVNGSVGGSGMGTGGGDGAGAGSAGVSGMRESAAGVAAGVGVNAAGASGETPTQGDAGRPAADGGKTGAPMPDRPADCPAQPLGTGDHTFTIRSANGLTYSYVLAVPKGIDPNRKAPAKVVWHALWSSPEESRELTDIDAEAEAAGLLLVFPRSPDQAWDTGSCCIAFVAGRPRDEEIFARELIKDVTSKVCVDEHRIYTTGLSNGGMLSQLLACTMADVFANATPMSSTLTIPTRDCVPARPISIFMINGTADPLVGYDAPSIAGGLSFTRAVQFWADTNKCTGTPEVVLRKGRATCSAYKQCAAGVEVSFCSIEGMGHCLPGMKSESPSNCLTKNAIPLGPANDDIDGIQMADEFSARFQRP